MTTGVPVVDFSAYSLDRSLPDEGTFQDLIDGVYDAITTIGFVYLSNHGIPEKEVNNQRPGLAVRGLVRFGFSL